MNWDALAGLLVWVLFSLIGAVAIAYGIWLELRAWWRTRRNRLVVHVLQPRCVECARKIQLLEPFTANAVQQVRCDGCGVHLHARRIGALWEICTVAEAKRQREAPLPAVRPQPHATRAAVALADPAEPGESALLEEAR